MNLHEYQAKRLFEDYGIPVPPGRPARTIREVLRHARHLSGDSWFLKAQVHAGGRGKAGGVRHAKNVEELDQIAREMLGSRLVTKQSAPDGQPVNIVLVQGISQIRQELYLSMVIDRSKGKVTIIASSEGGMDIEQVAEKNPEKVLSIPIDPTLGLQNYQCRQLGFSLNLDDKQRQELSQILRGMYKLFIDKDISLIEINPLIINQDGHLEALDAKMSIDDNALFRQIHIEQWRDPSQEDEKENIAKRFDLNYITLDGDIACMVNGAGLAMATMDIIKLHGGMPANFLDVGGGTTAERVTEAFKIIVSEANVKAILVNIFGGIVRCDLIADGILNALKEVGVAVPIVVRLEGTKVNQAREILAQSNLKVITADNLTDAAQKVIQAAKDISN